MIQKHFIKILLFSGNINDVEKYQCCLDYCSNTFDFVHISNYKDLSKVVKEHEFDLVFSYYSHDLQDHFKCIDFFSNYKSNA